jgi:hypothetical protein
VVQTVGGMVVRSSGGVVAAIWRVQQAESVRIRAVRSAVIDVNYSYRLATIILAGPRCGRGCDSPAAG